MSDDYATLAAHLAARRNQIMQSWRQAVKLDPSLTSGSAMPRAELNDHIPAILSSFERRLGSRFGKAAEPLHAGELPQDAAAHGLHRWQQGYDMREVIGELGRLNECMVLELNNYEAAHPDVPIEIMAAARCQWAEVCTEGSSASAAQYYRLQQMEAAGHVIELERALGSVRDLESQRAELWRQAAHDLRGNLGVVETATAGLASGRAPPAAQETILRLLQRNVKSLKNLLDDVTSLARLQAGQEVRQVSETDIATTLRELCDGVTHLVEEKGLVLHCVGPSSMVVQADAVKVRRIAQNLLLNAIKFTSIGGVTMGWGDSDGDDGKRWALTVQDTGSGFTLGAAATMAGALEGATNLTEQAASGNNQISLPTAVPSGPAESVNRSALTPGEGIGLSIVKRLCELLDATIEFSTAEGSGTMFRILLPRQYP